MGKYSQAFFQETAVKYLISQALKMEGRSGTLA